MQDRSFKDPLASLVTAPRLTDPLAKIVSIVNTPTERKNVNVATSPRMLAKAYSDDSDEEETTDYEKVVENSKIPGNQAKESDDSLDNQVVKSTNNYFEDW